MSHVTAPLNPITYATQLIQLAPAVGWTMNQLSPIVTTLGECPRPWFHRAHPRPNQETPLPKLYISTGIHGDETSGPLALLHALQDPDFFIGFDVTLFPILNPSGLALAKRENADGIDLNRDYRNTQSEEVKSHIAALQTLDRFDAAIMLHEDFEGIGAYLYELNNGLPPGLGAKMIRAMGQHVTIDTRPEIEEVRARNGVLSREDLLEPGQRIEDRERWPEAIYLTLNHTNVTITSETPMPQNIDNRVAAQLAAIRALMDELASVLNSAETWTK